MAREMVRKVFLDIETYGGKNQPTLDDISAPTNYKDPDKIKAYKEDKLNDAWRKQALDILKCEVICIGYAIDDNPVEYVIGNDEKHVVEQFQSKLDSLNYVEVIAYNGLRFDFPILNLRCLKYGMHTLRSLLPKDKREMGYTDVMIEVAGTLYGKDAFLKMSEVAKFFGIESKTGMDGSMVHDEYIKGNIKGIAEYCMEDVEVLRQLYYKTVELKAE